MALYAKHTNFVMEFVFFVSKLPLLKLKTRPRFCPVG
jgi:hypothetical protein